MKAILFFIIYLYQYFFYRLYKYGKFINIPFNKINNLFHINVELRVTFWSAVTLALIIMFNLSTLFHFLFGDTYELYIKTKSIMLIILIIITILNYIYFLRRKKYLKIEERFSKETIVAKILSSIFLLIILFETFYYALVKKY